MGVQDPNHKKAIQTMHQQPQKGTIAPHFLKFLMASLGGRRQRQQTSTVRPSRTAWYHHDHHDCRLDVVLV